MSEATYGRFVDAINRMRARKLATVAQWAGVLGAVVSAAVELV